jgi:hypothetical protein
VQERSIAKKNFSPTVPRANEIALDQHDGRIGAFGQPLLNDVNRALGIREVRGRQRRRSHLGR